MGKGGVSFCSGGSGLLETTLYFKKKRRETLAERENKS